jgi:hypothetical protein
MLLISTVTAHTPLVLAGCYMFISGIGLGLVMPVMLVAIQNAIELRDLGTGTASISFFRSMGGSFGVALFGAVLIGSLNGWLAAIPGHEALGPDPGVQLLHAGSRALELAPAALHDAVADALTAAFHDMFRVGAAISFASFLLSLSLKELPLRTSVGPAERAQATASAMAD